MLVAVDTGATKTLVAIFSKDGTVTSSEKFATPTDKADYIQQLTKTITSLSADQPIDAIAVALPGRTKDNILLSARNLSWKNFDVEKDLKKTFQVPILVENDANLAGLAESKELKNPVPVCLYITISTGIGTGIITDGQIDPHFSQSEGGQAVVNYRGRMRRWEGFASGKSIYKTYHTFAMNITSTLIWKRIAKDISKGLLVLTPTLRPDVIIIGGSIGTYFKHYGRYLTKELEKYLHYIPPIVAAKRPEEAVIYGCYHYAITHLSGR